MPPPGRALGTGSQAARRAGAQAGVSHGAQCMPPAPPPPAPLWLPSGTNLKAQQPVSRNTHPPTPAPVPGLRGPGPRAQLPSDPERADPAQVTADSEPSIQEHRPEGHRVPLSPLCLPARPVPAASSRCQRLPPRGKSARGSVTLGAQCPQLSESGQDAGSPGATTAQRFAQRGHDRPSGPGGT